MRYSSPGIRLGCVVLRPVRRALAFVRRAERARPDLIELLKGGLIELDLQGAEGTDELIHCARADDRACDRGVVEHPGQCDVGWLLAALAAEAFPFLQLR